MELMLGFYEFAHESETPFKDWAIDSRLYFAGEVLEVWRPEASPIQLRAEFLFLHLRRIPQLPGLGRRSGFLALVVITRGDEPAQN